MKKLKNGVTVGVISQARDSRNLLTLITQLRKNFPNNQIIIFYSGEKSEYFDRLIHTCNRFNCLFIYNPQGKSIGFARNTITNLVKTVWTLMFDSDTSIPKGFSKKLENLLKSRYTKDPSIALIQAYIIPQKEGFNKLAYYDYYNDTLSYLSNRRKDDHWFTRKYFRIPNYQELTTCQGICILYRTEVFKKIGGNEDISSGVDRTIAAKIIAGGYKIYFAKIIRIHHFYPTTLTAIVKRKIWHSRGSFYIRNRFPNYYPYTFTTRLKMLRSILFPPPVFRTGLGRLYYSVQMTSFVSGLFFHQMKYFIFGKI